MRAARQRLKSWRLRKGLSGRALSKRLGVATNAVCRIENGNRLPGRDLALKIYSETGINPADWNAKTKAAVRLPKAKDMTEVRE